MSQAAVFENLETERLLLRRFTLQDAEFVLRHFGDPEVTKYLLDAAPLATIEQAHALIDQYLSPTASTFNRWVLVHKADQAVIGTCGFHKWNQRSFRAEIGYDLNPQYQGHGLMTEALHAALQHGFDVLKLHRIEAFIYVENMPSLRLAERLGFRQEGVLRDYFYLNGNFHDHALWSLLRSEWPPK